MQRPKNVPNLRKCGVRTPAATLFMAGLLVAGVLSAKAAHADAADLVTAKVDRAAQVSLTGHRVGWAKAANDRGAVPDDLALTQLHLALKRTPERQQAFETLLREQRDPTSPNYQHWLSPTEIGERFGASQHDIDAISAWLAQQGLQVDAVSNSRTQIRFSGSAAAANAAFATELRYFQAGTDKRIATTRDPQIPAAFAAAVRSVEGLNSLRFTPLHRIESRSASLGQNAEPASTSCSGGVCSHAVFPADFATIYDLNPVHQQGIDGSGQTIAIVGRARVYEPDIMNFQSKAGLATSYPTVIVPPNGTDPGAPASSCSTTGTPSCSSPSDAVKDQSEATLDVTRAGSVAPGAAISLIVSTNTNSVDGVDIALDYAINHDPVPAKIVSVSFTSCEADNSQETATGLDEFFAQAEMEGITVLVASGDGGAAGCASLDSTPTAGESLNTNILCSSGHVTCVGGTSFADTANPSAYWSNSNGAGYGSALGYIPEGAWNEPLDADGHPQSAATGGGVSTYIAKPSWQVGSGVPGNAGRYTPDVSFGASIREGYFTCMAAQNGSCVVSNGSFSFLLFGGTSASAPSLAGVAALLNQATGTAQANLNPHLYALAANAGNGVFHDITVASSGVSGCALATPSLCNNSAPGPSGLSGGLQGYLVGAGYDLATGLGSIDIANLLSHWNSVSTTVNLDQHGLTGSWADLSTDSQGLLIEIYPDFYGAGRGMLFGGWFTFDVTAAGGTRWYTIQGEVDSTTPSATIPIQLTQGGRFDSSQSTSSNEVGQVTLQFSDCTHGNLDYTFSDGSGRSGTMALTRLTSNVTCAPSGDNGAAASNYPLSGAWADLGNSGQGFVFDVNPIQTVFFAAWYTFSTTGQSASGPAAQRWFTLQAPLTPGVSSLSDVPIYAVSGGVFDQPATTSTSVAGHADIVFHSCSSATLTYAFSAGSGFPTSGTLDLSRVGPVPAGCSL